MNFEKTNKLIGQEIPREEIKSILTSLDFKINNITETGVGITVPFYRHDVTRECDVVEEVLESTDITRFRYLINFQFH